MRSAGSRAIATVRSFASERMVAQKGLTDPATLERYHDAWDHAADRTPHGTPIELRQEDFRD